MNIEKIFQDDHQVKLIVTLDEDALDKALEQAVRKAGKNIKIPGFRPGKAPYRLLLNHIGLAEATQMAIDDLVDNVYPEVIKESGIDPYGPGSLTNIQSQKPPIFEFVVPLAPEVTLGDYKTVNFPYSPPEVSEEDVEERLEQLRNSRAVMQTVERGAIEEDAVYLQLIGKITGTDETVINEPYHSVIIGSDNGWPFPGFGNSLLGMQKGEKGTAQYTYSEEEFFAENLRGKDVTFEYEVLSVKSRELPELNDEFAQTFEEIESLEDLKVKLRDEQEKAAIQGYISDYDDQVVDEIVQRSEFKYPPQMVEDEVHVLMDNLKNRLSEQGITMDLYTKITGKDEKTLHEEFHPIAEKRIKRGLVLREISKAEGIKVNTESLQANVIEYLQKASAEMTPKQRRELITQDTMMNLMNNTYSEVLINKTLARLRNLASGGAANAEEDLENLTQSTDQAEEASEPSGDVLEITPEAPAATEQTEQA